MRRCRQLRPETSQWHAVAGKSAAVSPGWSGGLMNQAGKYGLLTLTCVVIASMIGSGVFTTSGFSMAALGSAKLVMLAWCCGGLIAICGAISYAELSRRLPMSGGEYTYLSRRLNPAVGFLAGWVSLTAGFSGAIALAALTCDAYFAGLNLLPEIPPRRIAVALILLAGIGHAFLSQGAARLQDGIVLLKVVVLLIFLGSAAGQVSEHPWHWQSRGESGAAGAALVLEFARQLMWISLSYTGFNAAIYIAAEVRDASVTVPRALVIGTCAVTTLYLLLNLTFVTAVPANEISGQKDIAAIAAQAIGGPRLETLMRAAVVLGTASSVAGMIMTGPRVFSRMAEDGLFPRFFSAEQDGVSRTVMLQTGIAMVLVIFSDLQELLSYLSSILALSSALTVLTLFLPERGSDLQLSPVSPGVLLAAGIYVTATCVTAALMLARDPKELYGAGATILVGLVLWQWVGRSRWKPGAETES